MALTLLYTYTTYAGTAQLLTWMQLLAKAELSELVDPCLTGNFDKHEVSLCAQIVLLCTRIQPELRPSMSDVRRILEGSMQVPISGSLDSTPLTSSRTSFVSTSHFSGSFYGTSQELSCNLETFRAWPIEVFPDMAGNSVHIKQGDVNITQINLNAEEG